jgi:hypothetical protein
MQLSDYLIPETEAPRRDHASGAQGAYLRAYLLLRVLIGLIGICLPVALILLDWLGLAGSFAARGSLSAYYHSGVRDIFVGALWAIGVFLITYKVFERSLENTLTLLAGAAVIGVAIFPIKRPDEIASPLTPWQTNLGQTPVSWVHYLCATLPVRGRDGGVVVHGSSWV